jgi:hypothetical protein
MRQIINLGIVRLTNKRETIICRVPETGNTLFLVFVMDFEVYFLTGHNSLYFWTKAKKKTFYLLKPSAFTNLPEDTFLYFSTPYVTVNPSLLLTT